MESRCRVQGVAVSGLSSRIGSTMTPSSRLFPSSARKESAPLSSPFFGGTAISGADPLIPIHAWPLQQPCTSQPCDGTDRVRVDWFGGDAHYGVRSSDSLGPSILQQSLGTNCAQQEICNFEGRLMHIERRQGRLEQQEAELSRMCRGFREELQGLVRYVQTLDGILAEVRSMGVAPDSGSHTLWNLGQVEPKLLSPETEGNYIHSVPASYSAPHMDGAAAKLQAHLQLELCSFRERCEDVERRLVMSNAVLDRMDEHDALLGVVRAKLDAHNQQLALVCDRVARAWCIGLGTSDCSDATVSPAWAFERLAELDGRVREQGASVQAIRRGLRALEEVLDSTKATPDFASTNADFSTVVLEECYKLGRRMTPRCSVTEDAPVPESQASTLASFEHTVESLRSTQEDLDKRVRLELVELRATVLEQQVRLSDLSLEVGIQSKEHFDRLATCQIRLDRVECLLKYRAHTQRLTDGEHFQRFG